MRDCDNCFEFITDDPMIKRVAGPGVISGCLGAQVFGSQEPFFPRFVCVRWRPGPKVWEDFSELPWGGWGWQPSLELLPANLQGWYGSSSGS